MAEVVLEQLTKVYPNGTQAVRDLNLHIADGEFMVLMGPSGCGKTTTLRLVAGLEEATAGNILIDGQVVNTLPPRRRDVAMVFQKSTLYPHLDVRRNLAMSLCLRRHSGPLARLALRWLAPHHYAEAQERDRLMAEAVSGAARLLGLEEVLNRLPGQLSGGQQQRVALGRAIVRRPGVFLLDEPLSQLDSRLRAELRHELHLLQRRLRATMIYVTHDQAEAMTLADRIAVMDRGVVQQVGPPLEVYEHPANRFVAGLVGWPPMNFAEGRLAMQNGRLCFACDSWSLLLPPTKAAAWQNQADRAVTLGIRPEDIRVALPGQKEATLSVEVVLVEPLGYVCLVTVRHGSWQAVAICPGPTVGSEMNLKLNMERVHLFDGATGLALNNGRPAG